MKAGARVAEPSAVFIPLEQLGILETRLQQAVESETKRKRQIARNSALRLLRELDLIPPGGIAAIARGINSLGDKGFWIIFESGFADAHNEAVRTAQVEAQGPQHVKLCPHYWNSTDNPCILSEGHQGDHIFKEGKS